MKRLSTDRLFLTTFGFDACGFAADSDFLADLKNGFFRIGNGSDKFSFVI